MTDKETIREAIMRLSMCANRVCEICKYKDRPKSDLPSEDCKERSIKNVSILADEFLRKGDNEIIHCIDCKYRTWFVHGYRCGNFESPFYKAVDEDDAIMTKPDDFCSYGERKE